MRDIRIRAATLADAPVIAHVHVESWKQTYRGIVPDALIASLSIEQATLQWTYILGPGSAAETVHVAEDTTVVGFGSAGPARTDRLGADGEIFWIYLLDDVKRRGIGRALFGVMMRELASRGHQTAGLWVLTANAQGRQFYEALSGRTGATRETNHEGHVVNEIAYLWELSNFSPVTPVTPDQIV
jgi:ribosomal protein S18 acetylase RimI-like enzyme